MFKLFNFKFIVVLVIILDDLVCLPLLNRFRSLLWLGLRVLLRWSGLCQFLLLGWWFVGLDWTLDRHFGCWREWLNLLWHLWKVLRVFRSGLTWRHVLVFVPAPKD